MKRWTTYTERYRGGEWRTPIFLDMILEDVRRFGREPTLLDIGCGNGFDGEAQPQQALAGVAGRYIGVEPDPDITLGPYFTETHRCFFEDAPVRPGSVDVAFAVMVLEHLAAPARFWDKLGNVLAEGGVFWGFTVDARHWFSRASQFMERLHLKDVYLNAVHGSRGTERYHNYPTYYRANTPRQVLPFTQAFGSRDFINFARPGQLAYYLPRWLRPLGGLLERCASPRGRLGSLLAMRVARSGSSWTEQRLVS